MQMWAELGPGCFHCTWQRLPQLRLLAPTQAQLLQVGEQQVWVAFHVLQEGWAAQVVVLAAAGGCAPHLLRLRHVRRLEPRSRKVAADVAEGRGEGEGRGQSAMSGRLQSSWTAPASGQGQAHACSIRACTPERRSLQYIARSQCSLSVLINTTVLPGWEWTHPPTHPPAHLRSGYE